MLEREVYGAWTSDSEWCKVLGQAVYAGGTGGVESWDGQCKVLGQAVYAGGTGGVEWWDGRCRVVGRAV